MKTPLCRRPTLISVLAIVASFAVVLASDSRDRHSDKEVSQHETWCNVLEIVEGKKSNYSRILDQCDYAVDSVRIDSILSAWFVQKDFETRPDTPRENEWRSEMELRLDYCFATFSDAEGRLSFVDLRVRAVLLNGIPVDVNRTEGNCWHPVKGFDPSKYCAITEMVFRGGLKMAFQSNWSSGRGWQLIPHQEDMSLIGSRKDRIARANLKLQTHAKPHVFTTEEEVALFPDVKERIKPTFSLASFPNDDGTFAVWTVSAVETEQLKADSSNQVQFVRRDVVYENTSGVPRIEVIDSSIVILRASDAKSKALYPSYGSCNLDTGEYNYTLSLYDDDGGLGIVAQDFSLPSNLAGQGISDILLTLGLAHSGDSTIPNRVVRNEWVMRANSYPVYYAGDTLFFYAEADLRRRDFKTDARGSYAFRVYCNLLPANRRKSEEIIQSDEPYMLRDSTDAREVEKIIRERRKKNQADKNLIYSNNRSSTLSTQTIHDWAVVPGIAHGEYYLVLRVDDVLSPASMIALKTIFIK